MLLYVDVCLCWQIDQNLDNHFNLLTTDDAVWHCLTLAACYQLAVILKINFALAKKSGIGGCGRVLARGVV